MADVDVEESAAFRITLDPDDYGQALHDALHAVRAAHWIVVSAVNKDDITFFDIASYVHLLDRLQETCGCKGVVHSFFFDEAVDSWEEE